MSWQPATDPILGDKRKTFSGMDVSLKDGGRQIEYEDEDPQIHAMFESDLAAHNAVCRMKALMPWVCQGEMGPTSLGGSD